MIIVELCPLVLDCVSISYSKEISHTTFTATVNLAGRLAELRVMRIPQEECLENPQRFKKVLCDFSGIKEAKSAS